MGTFISQEETPTLYEDKEPAPGQTLRPGWTTRNVPTAQNLTDLKHALLDVRTDLRPLVYDDAGALPTKAAGSTSARTLAARFSDVVNVKDFGATGDGTTDDTAAVQAAIDAGSTAGKGVFFPAGTYSVTNLLHGTTAWEGAPRKSLVVARSGGSADYLVASPNWLAVGGTFASAPWGLCYGIDFDAAGLKTHCVVLRTYFTRLENCRVKGATDTDLLLSADAKDGTLLASTMVNNEAVGCWLGVDGATAQYNLRTVDTNAKVTDAHILGCYLSGATVANLRAEITAGWHVEGCHLYGAPSSAYLYKPNVGTRVTGNYFEDEVRLGSSVTADYVSTFGPGNYFKDHVWADFNSVGHHIVSTGNTYGEGVELRHAFFSASKVMVSSGDVFRSAQPFAHHASAGGAVQNASTGKFRALGAYLAPIGRLISAEFDASGASSTLLHRQTSWDSPRFSAIAPAPARVAVTYSASMTPAAHLGSEHVITPNNATAFTINAPAAGGATSGQRLTVRVINSTAGALGAATWASAYKMAAWTQPATGFSRAIDFTYDGTNWVETSRTPADVPN